MSNHTTHSKNVWRIIKINHNSLIMNKLFSILILFFVLFACSKDDTENAGNWVKQSDFEGVARSSAVSFVIDNTVYVGLGFNVDQDIEYLSDFWQYNSTGDYWKKVADFPGGGRIGAFAFTVNGKAYVGTGYNGKEKLKDVYEYDPKTNVWTKKADFGGSARYGTVGFSIGSNGYVGTGYDGSETRDFWIYNPTSDLWTQTVSMGGSKRRDAVSFIIDGKAYVGTGIANGVYQTDLWLFDPVAVTWTQKAALNYDDSWTIIRRYAVAFTLNNKGYVTLGEYSGVRNDIWEYDPVLDTWDSKTAFESSSRQEAITFNINNKAYVGLGRSSSYYFDDIWEFRPLDAYDEDD